MTYPVMLNVKLKKCLVVGAGKTAERKTRNLLDAGARVHVVSPDIAEGIMNMLKENNCLTCEKRRFRASDLDGKFLVIAATSDVTLNERICLLASRKAVLSNSVNSRRNATFSNMAVIEKNGVVVGVSSHGRNVGKTMEIKKKIEGVFE